MSKPKKKKKSASRNIFLLFIVFIIIGGMYYAMELYMGGPIAEKTQIIHSEYTLLENNDSTKYMAVAMYNESVNINSIALTFYLSEVFWPYIFIENKNVEGVKRNPLDMPKGVILKIPRLPDYQLDLNNEAALYKARHLADSILNANAAQ